MMIPTEFYGTIGNLRMRNVDLLSALVIAAVVVSVTLERVMNPR